MKDFSQRIAALSPEQRALLERRLKEKGFNNLKPQLISNSQPNSDTGIVSYAQERLWLLHQLQPDLPLYNEVSLFKLTGYLDITALERSFNLVIQRHQVLRSKFVAKDGKPISQIASSLWITLPIVEIEQQSNPVARAMELAIQEARKPFDLSKFPLFRLKLYRLSEQKYLWLIVVHHIICDGWSMGIFIREIATLYADFLAKKSPSLPELSIQYTDFASWEKQLPDNIFATQLDYWKKQLRGSLPNLEIPSIHRQIKTTKTDFYRGARESVLLSPQLSQTLKTLSQQKNVTLFMLLLAAFKVLLYRYTNLEDILVGSPIANRSRPELEGAIGIFLNTLVLRSDLSGEPTFSELLQRVKKVALEAYCHQDLPFEKLVAQLQPERNTSQSPLFQVMFNLYNLPTSDLELPGLTVEEVPLDNGMALFDLTLEIRDSDRGLNVCFEYNSDRFGTDDIKRMSIHYQTLLENVVVNPDLHLSQINLLTAKEQQQLLVEWNNTEVEYPQDKCIQILFEEQVERTPDAVAVVFGEQQLTYRELNQKANQLAHYLQQLGVKPEETVGICVERSLEMSIAILGVLKAGGAYVPLAPTYPCERITEILQDARVRILLTQQHLEISLPKHQTQLVYLERNWSDLAQQSTHNCRSQATSENLAYLIYTSGSTGKPKGVAVTHQALVNYTLDMARQFSLQPSERVLQFASIGFDVAVEELFPTWLSGATVVVPANIELLSCREFQQLIETEQITVFELPTAYWHQWVGELFSCGESVPDCVRLVIVGGERISCERLRQWQQWPTRLIHVYGLTETTVTSTVYPLGIDAQPIGVGVDLPIGRPLANTQMYLLDSHLQPVPVGVAGEIYIGGEGLARGYLNRPHLTAERFIPNPFSDDAGSRLYQTGDKARYLPDGNIEYIGRIDYQVKLRGFRIELGEIESTLNQHPAVATSVVVLREDPSANQCLVAYYICARQLELKQLRDFLKQKLPEYMIPSAFVELEAFPLTPNGKIERQSLPVPDFYITTDEKSYIVPRNSIEEKIANIWQEVLNVKQVGIHDNFFELGGHSLLATQIISKIRQSLSVELPLRCLFETPTVAQLANQLEKANTGVEILPIKPVPRDRDLPLSFAQQRLWFLAQLEPESFAYNDSSILELEGELNLNALSDSINEIVRRHEVLRTSFTVVDGEPKQQIAAELTINLAIADLQELTPTEREREIKRLGRVYTQQVFDLTQAPLFRLTLLRLKSNKHLLLITMHHIISDAWSTGVFIRELSALYTAFVDNRPNPLPELPIQYADFAVWQRKLLQKEFLATQLSYWQKQLSHNLPVLNLPTARSRQEITTNPSAKETFIIPPDLSQAVTQLSQQEGVSLFMTVLAVLQVLLQRYTSQDDIIIGTDVANRNRSEIESLIGFFVNLLVLRTNLSGNPSFTELLQRVRQVTLGAYAHQDLPFDRLVKALQPERYLSHTPPLFQVLLVLQNAPMPAFELPRLSLKLMEVEDRSAKFDLALFLQETERGIEGKWQYNADLFSATTITRLSIHFQNLLNSVTKTPDARINTLEMLSDREREELNRDKQRKKLSKLAKFKTIKPQIS